MDRRRRGARRFALLGDTSKRRIDFAAGAGVQNTYRVPQCAARRPIATGTYPSLCEGCLLKGTIPRREQAVFTFGRTGMSVLRRNRNDRSGSCVTSIAGPNGAAQLYER
jgi:hypothetical protein